MKVLVATVRTQGNRANDFSHTTPGELVMFGSECDHEPVDGPCGCRRALCGVDTMKATTTFEIADRDMSTEAYIDAVLDGLKRTGFTAYMTPGEAREIAVGMTDDLLLVAQTGDIGDVVERRGTTFRCREHAVETTPTNGRTVHRGARRPVSR